MTANVNSRGDHAIALKPAEQTPTAIMVLMEIMIEFLPAGVMNVVNGMGPDVGGYKQSGIGRETYKMMLNHYQQTKNVLMSYNPNKLGFF